MPIRLPPISNSSFYHPPAPDAPSIPDVSAPSKPSDPWSSILIAIAVVFFLYLFYRSSGDKTSTDSTPSLDGKDITKEVPKKEKVLCIIRIYREAIESPNALKKQKNPGYAPIPVKIEITAEKRAALQDLRKLITLPEGNDFVDFASFLPPDEKLWIEIKLKEDTINCPLIAKDQPALYQIKSAEAKLEQMTSANGLRNLTRRYYEYRAEISRLSSFFQHPPINLNKDLKCLLGNKIAFTPELQMILEEEDPIHTPALENPSDPSSVQHPPTALKKKQKKKDAFIFENQSDRSIIVLLELKHKTSDPFTLTYSLKPHIKPVPPRYANKIGLKQAPKPTHVPLEQIITDFKESYRIKQREERLKQQKDLPDIEFRKFLETHQRELLNPQYEDFSIVSIKYASY